MKILMVSRRYPPDVLSGTETVFQNLVRQASSRHDVRLVVGYRRRRQLVPEDAVAVDLRDARHGLGHARMWWRTAREIRAFKPDVVLSNSIEVPVFAPTVCIVHDLNFGKAGRDLGSWGRILYYRLKSRRFARLVTVSEAMKARLAQAGLPAGRLVAIRNGVDLERFCPAGTPQGEKLILAYPSRILPGKGQHVAIDAVARLDSQEKAQVELHIVGAVADPVYLEQLRVQAYHQPVTFHLDVPDIVPYYQRADIILFPTLMSEGFGFTAVDGMACGKPVIVSDQPAIREATGGLAVYVRGDDVVGFRDAIRRLLGDPEARRSRGREGRSFVEGQYDWAHVWSRYEAVLQGAVRSRRRGS